MRLFVDSANVVDIEAAIARGIVSGITTNPTIWAREAGGTVADIIALLQQYELNIPLSVEVTTCEPTEMLHQAFHLFETHGYGYSELYIKIPIGWDELKVVRHLRRDGIMVNVTACMSYNQAIMAANAGANFVSLFWGRIRDTGQDAAAVVRQIRETFDRWHSPSQIIVGSIRQMIDVNEAIQAGADIVTVPPQFLPLMCKHPKTDEAVSQFMRDAQGG